MTETERLQAALDAARSSGSGPGVPREQLLNRAVDPLTVACPRCGAQPRSADLPDGERCKTRSGRPDNPHRGRVELAEAAAQQKEPTVPQDAVPTVDAAAAGLTPPPTWNPTAPSATSTGAATSTITLNPPSSSGADTAETAPEQDQQGRLPTDPALRRAALKARSVTATPDEDTSQTPRLDVDRLTDEEVDRVATAVAERIAAQAEQFTAELVSPPLPHPLGQTVWFRSRTGRWTAPAIITATLDSLYEPNVEAGHVPPLSSPEHVHLTVQTPGIQGHVSVETADEHPELVADDRPNKPAGGTFQEWDVPRYAVADDVASDTFRWDEQPAGTWMWPL